MNIRAIDNYSVKPSTLKRITQIERFTGTWIKLDSIQPAIIEELQKANIVTSAGASTRIEGALLSDNEVESLINQGCKITRISSRSEREVVGYVRALKFIYQEGRSLPVTEHSIRSLHQLMTADFTSEMLPEKQRGVYKDTFNNVIERNEETGEERVWFETTAPGPATATAMSELVSTYHELIEKELPELVTVAWFVVHFLAIHPFRDGNGRLSRLITIWLLLKHQYSWVQYVSHEKFIEDHKELYYVSLRKTQGSFVEEKVDYHHWIDFFMMILSRQVSFLEQELIPATMDVSPNPQLNRLNKNEQSVVALISKQGAIGISQIEQNINLSRDGLKKLLRRLVEKEIIVRTGKAAATRYKIGF